MHGCLLDASVVLQLPPLIFHLRSSHGRSTSNVVANDSGIGADNGGIEGKGLSAASVSFLVKLWQQTSELALSLSGRTVGTLRPPGEEKSRSPSPDLDESLRQAVVVMGPPGTEPRHGLSEGRFDRSESIVYKRNSTHVSLPHQAPALKVRGIVPKDTPRLPLEVFMCPRTEEDFENRRWTRSGARAVQPITVEMVYAVDSASSSESDVSFVRTKAHTSAKQRRNPVRETIISTEPMSVDLGSDLEASPPRPLDSSSPKEEAGSSPNLTSELASSPGDSCTEAVEPDDEIDWEPIVIDRTIAARSGGEKPPRLSVGSATDVSETPLSSPSGIRTVLSDLRNRFPLRKKRRISKTSVGAKQKAVGSSSIPIRATPRRKPCSVVVERLPWKLVVECMRRQHAQKLAAKNRRPTNHRSTPATMDNKGGTYPTLSSVRTEGLESAKVKLEAMEVATPVRGKSHRMVASTNRTPTADWSSDSDIELGRPSSSQSSAVKLEAMEVATPVRGKSHRIVASTNRTPTADWSSDSDFELGRPSSSQSSAAKRTPLVDGVRVASASSGSRGRALVQATMDSFAKTPEPVQQRAETSGGECVCVEF